MADASNLSVRSLPFGMSLWCVASPLNSHVSRFWCVVILCHAFLDENRMEWYVPSLGTM